MVTKLGPLCKVKLLKDKGDKLVVRSPEKAGGGGSTPSLATIFSNHLQAFLTVTWSHLVTIQFTKRLSRSTARC
jgi:hypothetical protein